MNYLIRQALAEPSAAFAPPSDRLTAVFDIGRTNKKLLLFDDQYRVVEEISETLPETVDDDGFPAEDVAALTAWVRHHWQALRSRPDVALRTVNVAAYGASLVHLDANGQPVAPLYSYQKPLPDNVAARFYAQYGPPEQLAAETHSPAMGMLNSGLQLYWLKHTRPDVFARIRWSLHLPQYVAFLLTGRMFSDFTSVGCHTALWDYTQQRYHRWVDAEGLTAQLAPIGGQPVAATVEGVPVGGGLHDSSAVIMAYLGRCPGRFLVVSTGTWAVTFNPFRPEPLTDEHLRRDCLSYLTVGGASVPASRLFLGREHDYQVARLAERFKVAPDYFRRVRYQPDLLRSADVSPAFTPACMSGTGPFPDAPPAEWSLSRYRSPDEAYHHLLHGLVQLLTVSIELIDNGLLTVYVDGGFARNRPFMHMLADALPDKQVFVSQLPQATAIGAALYVRQDDAPVIGWTFSEVGQTPVRGL